MFGPQGSSAAYQLALALYPFALLPSRKKNMATLPRRVSASNFVRPPRFSKPRRSGILFALKSVGIKQLAPQAVGVAMEQVGLPAL